MPLSWRQNSGARIGKLAAGHGGVADKSIGGGADAGEFGFKARAQGGEGRVIGVAGNGEGFAPDHGPAPKGQWDDELARFR